MRTLSPPIASHSDVVMARWASMAAATPPAAVENAGVDAVAGGLHDHAVVLGDCTPHDLVVARQALAHGVGMLLPQAGRALDVGEEEGDRPCR